MNLGDWVRAEARRFREKNDHQRLRMVGCYREAYQARETDPDRAFAAFTEGRRLAALLGEPWWVLFYEHKRIEALLHYKCDYRRVLDLAVACTLEVRKPANQAYPGRHGAWDGLVAAYLGIDVEGYADRIREALAYLEKEVPREPDGSRYLLLARQRFFAMERGQAREAYDVCMRVLELASADRDQSRAVHFATCCYCTLCRLAGHAGEVETLADWSARAAESARTKGHQCEHSEALAWQAVAALRKGDEAGARRLRQNATAQMARLKRPPKQGYFEALVCYHEQRGDADAALAVRDAELGFIEDRGRHLYETRVRLERCEMLRRLGRLTAADLAATRAAAGRLRQPETHLARVEQLAA
jgi:hypothetical protein